MIEFRERIGLRKIIRNTGGRGRLDVFLPERKKLKGMIKEQKRKRNIQII